MALYLRIYVCICGGGSDLGSDSGGLVWLRSLADGRTWRDVHCPRTEDMHRCTAPANTGAPVSTYTSPRTKPLPLSNTAAAHRIHPRYLDRKALRSIILGYFPGYFPGYFVLSADFASKAESCGLASGGGWAMGLQNCSMAESGGGNGNGACTVQSTL
jgi:hypothetical protein